MFLCVHIHQIIGAIALPRDENIVFFTFDTPRPEHVNLKKIQTQTTPFKNLF